MHQTTFISGCLNFYSTVLSETHATCLLSLLAILHDCICDLYLLADVLVHLFYSVLLRGEKKPKTFQIVCQKSIFTILLHVTVHYLPPII